MHIQYFCFAGVTRSVMAENLSRLLEPSIQFSSAGVCAKTCWELDSDERIEYIAKTALGLLNDPLNDFAYRGGDQFRDVVAEKAESLDLSNLDMERFGSDEKYRMRIREGLQDILRDGLAPNEIALRDTILGAYGALPQKWNDQLVRRDDVDLYLGMSEHLAEQARGIVSDGNPSFIGDFSEAQLTEPNGNLFAIGRIEPYRKYAAQLHDVVLPKVINKAVGNS